MAIRPSRQWRALFAQRIFPLRNWWMPLKWLWGIIISGIGLDGGSHWFLTKNVDVSGTLLGWLIGRPGITFPILGSLIILTCLAGLAHLQVAPTAQRQQSLALSSQQRLMLIRSLQREYGKRMAHSLQGRGVLELGLHERPGMIVSSSQFVFHDVDTTTEHPLPPGTSIIQVYDDAQRGLLILGKPGSGKTTLLLNLVMELLQRAESDPNHPLPIVLNLSSWARAGLQLDQWMIEQCQLVYGISKERTAAWITSDQVLFLLDGLDEVEDSACSKCISAIKGYWGEHLVPLVVCSRSHEYENQPERLNFPTALEIQPLEPTSVTAYLKQGGKSLAAVRSAWQNKDNSTLKQLLTTPLLLSIVILTYRDKAVKDLPQMGSPEDQQRHIFQHYVQRMLERHQKIGTFSERLLLRSLPWLAQQMQHHSLTEFYLEQLEPTWLATKHARLYHLLYGLIIGLLIGFPATFVVVVGTAMSSSIGTLSKLSIGLLGGAPFGLAIWLVIWLVISLRFGPLRGLLVGLPFSMLAGLIFSLFLSLNWGAPETPIALLFSVFAGLTIGLIFVLPFGLLAGLLTEQGKKKLTEKVTWSWKGSRKGIVFGLIGAPVAGLFFGLTSWLDAMSGINIPAADYVLPGPIFGLSATLIFGLLGGISGTPLNPNLQRRPNQGIHISGLNAIRFGFLFLVILGSIVGLIFDLVGGQSAGLLAGLLAGPLAGLFGGLFGGGVTYLQHYVLRFLLWRSSVLPWRTISLLEEANSCILLQRVGGGYRFIHPLLQVYFADLATPPTTLSVPVGKESTASS